MGSNGGVGGAIDGELHWELVDGEEVGFELILTAVITRKIELEGPPVPLTDNGFPAFGQ